jgi:hypothetical protein
MRYDSDRFHVGREWTPQVDAAPVVNGENLIDGKKNCINVVGTRS